MAQLRQTIVAAFRERFKRAVQNGDLPAGTDCATLAHYVATMLNGLAVQAASGATEKELRLVAALATHARIRSSGAVASLRRVFSMLSRTRSSSAPGPQGRTLPSTGSGW